MEPLKELAKALAGGFVLVSGTLAFLGATGNGLEAILRNHPVWSLVLFTLAGLAIGMGILAPLFFQMAGAGQTTKREFAKGLGFPALWLIAGFLVLGGSLVGLSWLAIDSKSGKERPRIESTFSVNGDLAVLEGKVKASGLRTSEHILILVEGHSHVKQLSELHGGLADAKELEKLQPNADGDYVQLVYAARAGGDADGAVEMPFKLEFDSSFYERLVISAELRPRIGKKVGPGRCDENSARWGCVQIIMPPSRGDNRARPSS
jgi:hypothetical protein